MKRCMLDICTACSAKCKYCLHQSRNMVPARMMSDEHFGAIRDILVREGWRYVYMYLSGEPLLHPKYWDMALDLSKHGITTDTASKLCFRVNWRAAREAWKQLKSPMHFDITIDAHNQELQDRVSLGINNNEVFYNLAKLASMQNRKLGIQVVTVVNAYNAPHLDEIKARVLECGVTRWVAKPMGYYMGYLLTPEDERMIVGLAPRGNQRFAVVDGHVVSKKHSCGSYLKPVIGVAGDVTLCCHDMLYREAQWNVLETGSLDKIVSSASYREAHHQGSKMKLSICEGCN